MGTKFPYFTQTPQQVVKLALGITAATTVKQFSLLGLMPTPNGDIYFSG